MDVLKPLKGEEPHLLLGKTRRTGAVRNRSVSAEGNEKDVVGSHGHVEAFMKMLYTPISLLCCEEIEI